MGQRLCSSGRAVPYDGGGVTPETPGAHAKAVTSPTEGIVMVDADNKVVIIVNSGNSTVLFQSTGSDWNLESVGDFDSIISQFGSVEVSAVLESNILTFTVSGVEYSFNNSTKVITPTLEVE